MLKFGNTYLNFGGGTYLTGFSAVPGWVELNDIDPQNMKLGILPSAWGYYNSASQYKYEASYYGDPKVAPYNGIESLYNISKRVGDYYNTCTAVPGTFSAENNHTEVPNYILSKITLRSHQVVGDSPQHPKYPKDKPYFELTFPTLDKIKVQTWRNIGSEPELPSYHIPSTYEPHGKKTFLELYHYIDVNDTPASFEGNDYKTFTTYTTGNLGSLTGCTIGQPLTFAILRKVRDGSYSAYYCENSGTSLNLFITGVNDVGYNQSATDAMVYSGTASVYHSSYTNPYETNGTYWGCMAWIVENISQSAYFRDDEIELSDFNDMAIHQETKDLIV